MPGDAEEREHWAEAAQTYDAEHRRGGGEALENELRSWLTRQLTDADEVLELGCGTGIFSAMIAGRVKHLTATDFSPEMLEQARRRLGGYDNVEIRSEDACQTSFADDSFNAVLAVNLLHHARAPGTVVRECRRVLAPGGRVLVVDCAGHGSALLAWIRASLRRLVRPGRPAEGHHHFTRHDLRVLMTDAGLTVQESTVVRQRRHRTSFICLCSTKVD